MVYFGIRAKHKKQDENEYVNMYSDTLTDEKEPEITSEEE